jgi:primosomal protein N' (replication factor Y)
MSTTNGAPSASVLIPLPLEGPYDYRLSTRLERGCLVQAPLGKREVTGVVWGDATGEVAREKLKDARALIPPVRLPETLCDFVDWVARYTLTPPGTVLAQAMRVASAFEREKPRIAFRIGAVAPERQTAARRRVLEFVSDGFARSGADIATQAGVSPSVVKALAKTGALQTVELPEFDRFPIPDPNYGQVTLSPDQAAAAAYLREAVKRSEFSAYLLDGVTGSGKTESYFEAVAEALAQNRQVLILLPEIALTVQFLDRFAARFGCRPAEWHSDMTERERRHAYRAALDGDARVVAGARSALFLPFKELGLIVIDEEHDQAYKQEEGVIYHARDMAVVRARLEQCPVVLSSATPSLETYLNAKNGRYEWLKLTSRHGAAVMPSIELVDLRKEEMKGTYISKPLRSALRDVFDAKEQALLFLNRRGYAPLTLCEKCGHKETCRNCSAWLVEHRYRGRLVCHHCGFEMKRPEACPECEAEDSLVACGPGVERVADEFREAFPEARIAIASSDTMTDPHEARATIEAFGRGEIDVIIGTQIIAKGHHFPQLTLAGVIDADLGGVGGDPRGAERSFQLLYQVAGRAGRAEKPGRVLIQTRSPTDPVIKALTTGSRDDFLDAEAAARSRARTPPFGRLAALILSGTDASKVRDTGRVLAASAPKVSGVRVWGPAPAFYQVLRGRTRERLLVHTDRNIDIQDYLRTWLAANKIPSAVRLSVDIDPMSFF